jgi:hypothetical protein
MAHSIDPSEDGDYIVLKEEGDYTREIAMDHSLDAHALGAELGIRCYLVDVTEARNVESTLTNYRIANRDIKDNREIDQGACVAVLVDPDDDSHDFYETLAKNAGIDLTVFRDREAAIEHLQTAAVRLRRPPDSSVAPA